MGRGDRGGGPVSEALHSSMPAAFLTYHPARDRATQVVSMVMGNHAASSWTSLGEPQPEGAQLHCDLRRNPRHCGKAKARSLCHRGAFVTVNRRPNGAVWM